jgi:hypothetical protein
MATSVHNAGAKAFTQELIAMASRIGDGPGCFVLLLDACTYDDDALAADVLAALEEGQRVVLVHDASIAFSDVIQRTPSSLMTRGIYNELAVAL